MRRRLTSALGLVLLAAWAGPAPAQQPDTVPGPTVERRTKALVEGVPWQTSLEDVLRRAKATERLGVWIQVVGDLDDGL